jgi:uncharacterized protein (TIGR04255 family)
MSPNEPRTLQSPTVEVYPGAPLRAVAIEVIFPALLDAFPRFAAFQRRHRADFDHLHEISGDEHDREEVPDGREFACARSALLMGASRERAVTVARDQLAVITYPYASGFAGFRSWAMPMLREGLADLGVERFSRVSFRYENRIRHDTTKLDLASVLRVSLPSPLEASAGGRHVHLYWHQPWTGGTVEIEIDACPHVSPREIHLNITAYHGARTGDLDEIDPLVQEAHRRARLTFEELITSRFRDELRSART